VCEEQQEVRVRQQALVEVPVARGAFVSVLSGFIPPQLHVLSVIQGDATGRLYVDVPEAPQAACLVAGEAFYLAGRASDGRFYDAVSKMLPRDRYTAVFVGRDVAAPDVARAVDGLYMMPARRRVAFLSRRPRDAFPVPAGIAVQPIDRALLAADLPGADDVREAVTDEWQTVDRVLERGFGTVARSGRDVVAHSVADYVVGDCCEIGVHVAAGYRRQGLGTAVAAATAREAFDRGLASIAWHSWANNVGSIAISRRLGFADEVSYDILFNHWAAENATDLSPDGYRAFGEAYERLFAAKPPTESGYPCIVAAMAFASARDRAGCLRNLQCAVDMGWLTTRDQLRTLWPELFRDPTLPERVPEWGALLARLPG